ncbi:hypothetical protein B0H14DRAFT_3421539 [Mycena olivaceomarginata]|nr:hypothetical protein B0H14DRAFT_3421539 [Mycena olivaceomarginata]
MRLAGYEHIRVDAHVPVLDIPVVLDHKPWAHSLDALEGIPYDPKVWGYLPLGAEDDVSYIFDTTLPDPPFRLFLIGSGSLEIPQELKNTVLIRDDPNYPAHGYLICLHFVGDNEYYYEDKASSTFAMAVECNVPILVPERIKNLYTYVDDRAVVTRPAAMREIEAVRALLTRGTSFFLHRTGIPQHRGGFNAEARVDTIGRRVSGVQGADLEGRRLRCGTDAAGFAIFCIFEFFSLSRGPSNASGSASV